MISVLVNTHDGGAYLKEALDSVYAQTVQDFEVVVFDNASTDDTAGIVEGYDERLRYERSDVFLHLGEARNRALAFAHGDLVAFLDADDVLLPRKLERQAVAFDGDVALVFSDAVRFWQGSGRTAPLYASAPPQGRVFGALLARPFLMLSTVMLRRDAIGADPSWWFPDGFDVCEETDLFLRIAHDHDARYVDEPLTRYRIHGGNWAQRRADLLVAEQQEIVRRLRARFPGIDEEYPSEMAAFERNILRTCGLNRWRAGDRAGAVRALRAAHRSGPTARSLAELGLAALAPYAAYAGLRRALGRPLSEGA